jgi:hypothetical protein
MVLFPPYLLVPTKTFGPEVANLIVELIKTRFFGELIRLIRLAFSEKEYRGITLVCQGKKSHNMLSF